MSVMAQVNENGSLPAGLRKHPELWFSDGTIILCVGSTAFRIHQGILSKRSKVFKDIFGIPQPNRVDTLEGCPVVHLTDSPDDIADVLGILYSGMRYQTKEEHPTWQVTRAMFRIGTKYQMDDIRAIAVETLEKAFPTDIKAYDDIHFRDRPCMTSVPSDSIAIANLARIHGDLPSRIRWQALYHCCQLPNAQLVNGLQYSDGTIEKLCPEDLILCLGARKTLTFADLAQTAETAFPPPTTECGVSGCIIGQANSNRDISFCRNIKKWLNHNPLNLLDDFIEKVSASRGVCEACVVRRKDAVMASRQEILNDLESYFRTD